MITINQIEKWLLTREDEHVEFKEANTQFDTEKLVKYCAALANERGGHLILGITDKIPRRVVGSQAFLNLTDIVKKLLDRIHVRVSAEEFYHSDGRIVVFTVPSRSLGTPIQVDGTYWMRSGESLTGMTPDMLKQIFAEAEPDFSASICQKAHIDDLDPGAITDFKARWAKKAANPAIAELADEQALRDAELLVDDGITYAALVLFGTRKALGRILPQSEVVFEYRLNEATGPANQRLDFRQGFFSFFEELWKTINLRNDLQHYQEGLFIWDVPTFEEAVVRESVLNAVSHRDYRLGGSIFIRQYPRKLEIESPGGLPSGITVENILQKQSPRNRCICDAFRRCGLVERSGQGMNRIYESCIRQSKSQPDFRGTDNYQVMMTLNGVVKDPKFIQFFEKVSRVTQITFSTDDFLVADLVHRDQPVPERLQEALKKLLDRGVLERAGRKKLILSRKFYEYLGKKGTYTRKKGLDKEECKALLLKHIRTNKTKGCEKKELLEVLPSKSLSQVSQYLSELRKEGKVDFTGNTKGAKWFPTELNGIKGK